MENANKTGVRFSRGVNGGFLEGAGLGSISIARTAKNQATVASKLAWIYIRLGISFM
jgi:hypothetical protein